MLSDSERWLSPLKTGGEGAGKPEALRIRRAHRRPGQTRRIDSAGKPPRSCERRNGNFFSRIEDLPSDGQLFVARSLKIPGARPGDFPFRKTRTPTRLFRSLVKGCYRLIRTRMSQTRAFRGCRPNNQTGYLSLDAVSPWLGGLVAGTPVGAGGDPELVEGQPENTVCLPFAPHSVRLLTP